MLKVITGAMKAGKTKIINDLIKDYQLMNKSILVFYPASVEKKDKYIVSRAGTESKAIKIFEPVQIFQHLNKDIEAIIIDEVQFLCQEEGIRDVELLVNYCYAHEINMIFCGLDIDFRAESFPIMNRLLSLADDIVKIKSICDNCKTKTGRRTLRLTNGEPSKYDENVLMLETEVSVEYKTVCVGCYNKIYGLDKVVDKKRAYVN